MLNYEKQVKRLLHPPIFLTGGKLRIPAPDKSLSEKFISQKKQEKKHFCRSHPRFDCVCVCVSSTTSSSSLA